MVTPINWRQIYNNAADVEEYLFHLTTSFISNIRKNSQVTLKFWKIYCNKHSSFIAKIPLCFKYPIELSVIYTTITKRLRVSPEHKIKWVNLTDIKPIELFAESNFARSDRIITELQFFAFVMH